MRNRDGIALAAAIFGIVVISLITVGTFMMTNIDTMASRNREDAATALRLAHTAEAHALSLFRTYLEDTTINRLLVGWDNASGTGDDALFVDWAGLGDSLKITAAGRTVAEGTYWAVMADDPSDPNADPRIDGNYRFIVRCAGQTPSGSRAVIEFVVKYLPPAPAIAFNGNTQIQGSPTAAGACGDIHANGDVNISGTITVNRHLSTSGTTTGSGSVVNAGGVNVGTYQIPVQIPIPVMTAAEYCPTADYTLRADGNIVRMSDGMTFPAVASAAFGWQRTSSSPVQWVSDPSIVTGSFCVLGNATISGGPGPIAVSVFATGSLDVSGNPRLTAEHASGVQLLADGDLYIRGNASTTYNGIIYGGSNCRASGNLNLTGQYLCQGGALPAGAREIVTANLIEGNPTFNYSCTWATPNDKYKIVSWYQRIGV